MANDDLKPLLVKHIRDAHAMEQNVLHMLTSMIVNTNDTEIQKGLEAHKEETRVQGERLTQRLEALGAKLSPVREVGAVLGALQKGISS